MIKATLVDKMGSDLSVVNAARVSFAKKSDWERVNEFGKVIDVKDLGHGQEPELAYCKERLKHEDVKLIQYLAKHKHFSPFGHCFASFHVKAPIFVTRQLVKHEYLRMNEVSRRYVDSEPEFYVPEAWRGRSKNKKQGSDGVVDAEWSDWQMFGYSLDTYNDMLASGVAPEMARMVLPQSMMTEWYWSGSLDAFANMCNLRLKEDTQYETRLVAQQIDAKMAEIFPVSWKALVHSE